MVSSALSFSRPGRGHVSTVATRNSHESNHAETTRVYTAKINNRKNKSRTFRAYTTILHRHGDLKFASGCLASCTIVDDGLDPTADCHHIKHWPMMVNASGDHAVHSLSMIKDVWKVLGMMVSECKDQWSDSCLSYRQLHNKNSASLQPHSKWFSESITIVSTV